MNTFLWWMLENSMATLALALIALFLCRFIHRRPAVRHLIWLVVLLKFVTPPVVSWPVDSIVSQLGFAVAAPSDPTHQRAKPSFASAPPVEANATDLPPAGVPSGAAAEGLSPSDPVSLVELGWQIVVAYGPAVMLSVWLIGSLLFAFQWLRQIRCQCRVMASGTAAPAALVDQVSGVAAKLGMRPVEVVLVKHLPSPCVWCFGRLRLAWPLDFCNEVNVARSRGIIAHELAHLSRKDHWTVWLELLSGLIWWWNPVFWFVRRQLREAAEMACDAIALRVCDDRREYAAIFLELSIGMRNTDPAQALGMNAVTTRSFERRLSMILTNRDSGRVSIVGLLMAVAFAFVALPALSWAAPQSDDTASEPSAPAEPSEVDTNRPTIAKPRPPLVAGDEIPLLEVSGWMNSAGMPDTTGKVVLVDFSASWCAPCRRSLPHVQSLADRYAKDGLQVIVLTDETKDDFEKIGTTLPTGFEVSNECRKAFGMDAWPSGYLFDHHGKFISEVSPQEVRLDSKLRHALWARVNELNDLADKAGQPRLPMKHLDPDIRLRRLQEYFDRETNGKYTVVHGQHGGEFDLLSDDEEGETSWTDHISDCLIPSDPAPKLLAEKWFNTSAPDAPPVVEGQVQLIFFDASGQYYQQLEDLPIRYADKGLKTIILSSSVPEEMLDKCDLPIGNTYNSEPLSVSDTWGIFGYPSIALINRQGRIAQISYLTPRGWDKNKELLPKYVDLPELERRVVKLLDK